MKDIVLFGIQGSGKWTQAKLLQEHFNGNLSYFSSGDVFRALKSHPNAIGDFLSNRLELGHLISDEVTIAMFDFYFRTVKDDNKMMLIDGYPRTLEQSVSVIQRLLEHKRDVIAIHFELSREQAKERMLERGRADDTPETIDKRIDLFYKQTIPNIELFEKLFPVVRIDASPSVEDVHKQVIKALWL